jgi:hypothetical protein
MASQPRSRHLPTPSEVAAAHAACLAERQALREQHGIEIQPDDIEIALTVANWVAAAVYGPRGELRK